MLVPVSPPGVARVCVVSTDELWGRILLPMIPPWMWSCAADELFLGFSKPLAINQSVTARPLAIDQTNAADKSEGKVFAFCLDVGLAHSEFEPCCLSLEPNGSKVHKWSPVVRPLGDSEHALSHLSARQTNASNVSSSVTYSPWRATFSGSP